MLFRSGGVTVHDQARAWNGQTFISLYRNGAYGAILIDMDGKVQFVEEGRDAVATTGTAAACSRLKHN